MSIVLAANHLVHSFGAVRALDGVSVQVEARGALAVVGESGSGKSTLLRCFNRLVEPQTGTVRVQGEDVRSLNAVALRRRIGYVPQSGGLLPHWTALRNVALVPTLMSHPSPADAAAAALEIVGLPVATYGTRYPHELSGGQRQRVALARALAAQQEIVLLDEPFSALDAISRGELHEVFANARATLGFTAVLITHDLAEAAHLADIIAVMRVGRIEQIGSMRALRDSPATPYVAALLTRAMRSVETLVERS